MNLKPMIHKRIRDVKVSVCFLVWRSLAGVSVPFYSDPKLARHTAPTAPNEHDWRGYKIKIWNWAVSYLLQEGELTHTPALKTRF